MLVLWINYPPTLIGIPLGNKRCHFDISECYPDSFILSASLNSLTKPFDFTKCLGFSISNGCVVWIGSRIDNRCAFVDNVQDISTDGFTWKINLQVVAIRNNNRQNTLLTMLHDEMLLSIPGQLSNNVANIWIAFLLTKLLTSCLPSWTE